MAFVQKEYLDYAGLKAYDEKIKALINQGGSDASSAIAALKEELDLRIDNVEALVGEEAVADVVNNAIAALIDGAPETFDTLKELSDWIQNDGATAAALLESVANVTTAYKDADAELQAYVDTQDQRVYDAINSIGIDDIDALFLIAVEVGEEQTVAEAIAALNEGEKLVIPAGTVDETLVINNDCVIEAEGVEFTGDITVAKDAKVNIIGATFSGAVKVQ